MILARLQVPQHLSGCEVPLFWNLKIAGIYIGRKFGPQSISPEVVGLTHERQTGPMFQCCGCSKLFATQQGVRNHISHMIRRPESAADRDQAQAQLRVPGRLGVTGPGTVPVPVSRSAAQASASSKVHILHIFGNVHVFCIFCIFSCI